MQELESAFAAIKEKGMAVSKMRMNANTFENVRKKLPYCEYAAETEYTEIKQGIIGELWGARIIIDNFVEDGFIILVGGDKNE
jgi:hypothetical protein